MKKSIVITAALSLVALALVAQPTPTVHSITLPVVGDVVGFNGEHFQTDVTLGNLTSEDQRIRMEWYPQDVTSTAPRVRHATIPAFTFETIQGFVPEILGTTGIGAVRFVAVTDDDSQTDVDAAIDAFARIWTPRVDGPGTVSQSLHGIYDTQLVNSSLGVTNVVLFGLRQNQDFRTNYGIVNLGPEERVFAVRINSSMGTTVNNIRVPAQSMTQRAIPAGDWGDLLINITPQDPSSARWLAYGSTVDNQSGDAWISQDAHRRYHDVQ